MRPATCAAPLLVTATLVVQSRRSSRLLLICPGVPAASQCTPTAQTLTAFASGHVRSLARVTHIACRVSPWGQRFISAWGSNRWAMGGAATLLMYANLPSNMRTSNAGRQNSRCTAVRQIHYMAGDNGRGSYVAGVALQKRAALVSRADNEIV